MVTNDNETVDQEVQEETYEEEMGGEQEEGDSLYMIDGVVMRMIQIEGEEQQYLMDPNGRIFDM